MALRTELTDGVFMALLPKEKKELQQRFEEQLHPDLLSFEEDGIVHIFNFDKSESGEYIDSVTQGVWEGFQDAEEWEKNGKHQKVKLPECPEPVEGWCDCGKCKAMSLHKEKDVYVCLVCHKQTEPFLPIDLNSNDWLPDKAEQSKVNLADWIKQEETELGENAFYHPNTEYFKVMREINKHEAEFVANSGDLIKMAEKHSITYSQLNEEDKEFVNFRLSEEIFFVSYDDE